MNCPVCADVTLVVSSREAIEIDYCPQCRGVWLDRGELDKIIERAAPAMASTRGEPQRAYDDRPRDDRRRDDDYYDDRRSKKKRRGGFLEDLFDFD